MISGACKIDPCQPVNSTANEASCDALSAPVAALVQAYRVDPFAETVSRSRPLVFYNRHGSPKISFEEGGLLSPASLLGPHLLKKCSSRNVRRSEEEAGILAALDARPRTPEPVMRFASRRLRLAASRAALDVAELEARSSSRKRKGGSDSPPPHLSQRVEAALKLLTSKHACSAKNTGGHTAEDSCAHLSATQLLLAELESILEILMHSCSSKATECTTGSRREHMSGLPKLKDFLRDASVREELGLPLILVLHVLLGPLNGVCLRNLVWHGYLGPREVEQSQWAPLLLLITAFAFPAVVLMPTRSRAGGIICTTGSFPNHLLRSSAIDKLLGESPFVPDHMRPAFARAIELCSKEQGQTSDTESDVKLRYWRALALLYCVLERGLRALFARENSQLDPSPELARVDALQLTMATMLRSTVAGNSSALEESATVSEPVGGRANGLLSALGDGPVAALYDEFVWMGLPDASDQKVEEPLPVRNELVHGTLLLEAVDPAVLARLLRITIGLAAVSAKDLSTSGREKGLSDPYIQHCSEWIFHYQSRRHPVCQIWRQFRSACGSCSTGHVSIVDTLLPRTSEPKDPVNKSLESTLAGQVNSTSAVTVQYCPVCFLPQEYCVYSPDPALCMEHHFGSTSSVALPAVACMGKDLVNRLILDYSADSINPRDMSLAKKIQETRRQLAPCVGLGDLAVEDLWDKFDAAPARRSASENELSKLWAVREAIENCNGISQHGCRRIMTLTAQAARGEIRIRVGRKKEPLVAVAHRVLVTLQGVELVLVMLLQQYLAADVSSLVLSTFLSLLSNTVLSHVKQGQFKLCVGIIAGLLGGGLGICPTCDEAVNEILPRSDRRKFSLHLVRYIQYAVHGQEFVGKRLITNQFILCNQESRRCKDGSGHDEGDEPTLQDGSGAAWESLRRWQQMSN